MRVYNNGQAVEGKSGFAEGPGRGSHRVPHGSGAGRSAQLLLGGKETRARNSQFLLSESVRQPDESRGALPHHGTGDLGGQRREDHALCLRVGHRRDHQRRGEVSEGKKSRGQDYWRRSIRSEEHTSELQSLTK